MSIPPPVAIAYRSPAVAAPHHIVAGAADELVAESGTDQDVAAAAAHDPVHEAFGPEQDLAVLAPDVLDAQPGEVDGLDGDGGARIALEVDALDQPARVRPQPDLVAEAPVGKVQLAVVGQEPDAVARHGELGRRAFDRLDLHHVVTAAVEDLVGAASRPDEVTIVPEAAVEHVTALVAHENVVASVPEQRVVALVAAQGIRAVAAVERHRRRPERRDLVIAVVAVGDVGALRRDPVVARATVDQVGAGSRHDDVVAVAAEEKGVPGASVQRVIPGAAVQVIIAAVRQVHLLAPAGGQEVAAVPADDRIRAEIAEELVLPGLAVDEVVAEATPCPVVARAAVDDVGCARRGVGHLGIGGRGIGRPAVRSHRELPVPVGGPVIGIAHQEIVARAADEHVAAAPAGQHVRRRATDQHVLTFAAGEPIALRRTRPSSSCRRWPGRDRPASSRTAGRCRRRR